MHITRFSRAHLPRCIEIFLTNQGKYFAPGELAMFRAYLENDRLTQDYDVIIEADLVIGCGGVELTQQGQVNLTWGMVHRKYHRKGYGTALLEHRLEKIAERFGNVPIHIETSQHTQAFFEKHGFKMQTIQVDGFGPGIDNVFMIRESP